MRWTKARVRAARKRIADRVRQLHGMSMLDVFAEHRRVFPAMNEEDRPDTVIECLRVLVEREIDGAIPEGEC